MGSHYLYTIGQHNILLTWTLVVLRHVSFLSPYTPKKISTTIIHHMSIDRVIGIGA
jgi:hypothetical protein